MPKGSARNKPVKKKKKPLAWGEPLKKFFGKVLPVVIPFLFFGFFFLFLSRATFHFLMRSSYFSVQTVEASSSSRDFAFKDPSLMGSLLGRNIFQVDLSDLQEEVSQKHPELLSAFVSREFPNRIRIRVTPRLPVAQIQSGNGFLVDRDGVILPYSPSPNGKELPLIVGIPERLEPSRVGYVLHSKALNEALMFVDNLQSLPEMLRYVRAIDVSDPNNLSFRTPEGLEVKVGRGDYQEKLKLFDRTRVSLGDRITDVKYIDLRFDEVVIGSR